MVDTELAQVTQPYTQVALQKLLEQTLHVMVVEVRMVKRGL